MPSESAINNVLSLLTKARGWAEELDDSTVILQKEKDELLLNIRRAQLSVEDYENASAEYTKVKVTIQSTTYLDIKHRPNQDPVQIAEDYVNEEGIYIFEGYDYDIVENVVVAKGEVVSEDIDATEDADYE